METTSYTTYLTALVGLGFLISAAAHSCNDGQRVTCMAVQSLPADLDTSSHGYGARGVPHCTPDGQKIYCLVNHDYHGCSQDRQPCCRDGSNPWHRQKSSDSASDDLTCTKEGVMLSKTVASTSTQDELPENLDINQAKTVPTDSLSGMLKLHLDLSHGHKHTLADLTLKLKKHQDLLETTLAVHFNFKNVWIINFGTATRRLSETQSINIRFAGHGVRSPVTGPSSGSPLLWYPVIPSSLGLQKALQKSLSAANVGVTIMGADVEWNDSRPTPGGDASQPGSTLIVLWIVGIFSALGGVAAALLYFMKVKGQKSKVVVENGSAAPENLGRTVDVISMEEGTKPEYEKSAEDALEVVSVDSTRSPASDAVPSEDAKSNEDRCEDLLNGSDAVEVSM